NKRGASCGITQTACAILRRHSRRTHRGSATNVAPAVLIHQLRIRFRGTAHAAHIEGRQQNCASCGGCAYKPTACSLPRHRSRCTHSDSATTLQPLCQLCQYTNSVFDTAAPLTPHTQRLSNKRGASCAHTPTACSFPRHRSRCTHRGSATNVAPA